MKNKREINMADDAMVNTGFSLGTPSFSRHGFVSLVDLFQYKLITLTI
jgi:hypothetical protein